MIVPCVNPDGSELAQEGSCFSTAGLTNAHGVDLDTDFISGQLVHLVVPATCSVGERFLGLKPVNVFRQHVCAARNACDDESDRARRLLSVCYSRWRLSADNIPL